MLQERRVSTTDEGGSTPKTLHPSVLQWREAPGGTLGGPAGQSPVRGFVNGDQGGAFCTPTPQDGEAPLPHDHGIVYSGRGLELGNSPPQVKLAASEASMAPKQGFYCSVCDTHLEAGRYV